MWVNESHLECYFTTYFVIKSIVFLCQFGFEVAVASGLQLGFWMWLGLIVTTHVNGVLYEKRPFALFAINMGHYLVSLLAAGAILALWR